MPKTFHCPDCGANINLSDDDIRELGIDESDDTSAGYCAACSNEPSMESSLKGTWEDRPPEPKMPKPEYGPGPKTR